MIIAVLFAGFCFTSGLFYGYVWRDIRDFEGGSDEPTAKKADGKKGRTAGRV